MILSSTLEELLKETAEYELLTKTPQKLKDLYNKCFQQAEYDGVPKHKIASTVFRRISEIKEALIKDKKPDAEPEDYQVNRSWFNECAHDAGVTDLKHSPVVETPLDTELPLAEDPFNSYIEPKEVNRKAINAMRTLRQSISAIETAFAELEDAKGNPLDLEDVYKKKDLNAFYDSISHLSDVVSSLTDKRTLVPLHTHHIFRACLLSETSVLNAGRLFLKIRADILEEVRKFMTQKQASKFQRGLERPQLPIFQPKNRDESIYMGWYGLQCSQCESWRSREKPDSTGTVTCYDCDNEWPGRTISHCAGAGSCGYLLYTEDLKKVKKNGKCPNCKKSLRLPKSLLAV